VLYVGRGAARAFGASAERRLESLGESLMVLLDNVRLQQALKDKIEQAAVADKLRDRFMSVLMHDLAEPLHAARERARHLRGEGGRAHAAAMIAHDLDRMRHMVDDLLDAHRIATGDRMPLAIAECNLIVVVGELVDEMRARYGDRFVVQAPKTVRGMWDADQLYRALWNLVTNAVEHGESGTPIFVSVVSGTTEAVVAVHNAGRAIAAAARTRLFKPFAHARLEEEHAAGGIGLALVWGCAEAHGGRVDVESAPGAGTTFSLYLPWDARPYADH
jgi:signal transduction histidine kinase